MSPFIAYIESVIICIFSSSLVRSRALVMACSSPIWFDCVVPGTLVARFFGLFSPKYTPLLAMAVRVPLFVHPPSV